MIWDDKDDDGHREAGEDGVEQLAVFLDDDRDGERDPGEPYSHKTNITGKYILPVPTRYIVAGGDAAAARARAPRRRRLLGAVRVRDHRPAARGRAA